MRTIKFLIVVVFFSIFSNTKSQIKVDASGNVGIKNDNPTTALDVTGELKVSDKIRCSSIRPSTDDWEFYRNGENLEIREVESSNLVWARFVDDNRLELLGTPNLHMNGYIRGGSTSGYALRISTPSSGYLDIGPKSEQWCHFYTDRPMYYFDKEIRVDQGYIGSYNEDLNLRTSGTTRMTISNSTGNVGIGVASPSYKLDVEGYIRAWNVSVPSDERLKENITDYVPSIEKLKKIRTVEYNMKPPAKFKETNDEISINSIISKEKEGMVNGTFYSKILIDSQEVIDTIEANKFEMPEVEKQTMDTKWKDDYESRKQVGFLAQEMEAIFPDLVLTDEKGLKSINYIGIIPVLVAGMQEQQSVIEKQQSQIEQQQKQIEELMKLVIK